MKIAMIKSAHFLANFKYELGLAMTMHDFLGIKELILVIFLDQLLGELMLDLTSCEVGQWFSAIFNKYLIKQWSYKTKRPLVAIIN